MNFYSYTELLNQYECNEQKIELLTKSNIENQINRRWELKQNKKKMKEIKYNIFLIRISSLPNVTHINELKDKIILLKDEKYETNCKLNQIYVENVRKLEICYGERLTINMMLRKYRNRA